MDPQELVTVYTVGNLIQAEIVKNALQAEGIRSFLEGENQAAEAGLMALDIKIQVAVGDVDRARKLIEAHDSARKAKTPHSWNEPK